MTDIFDQIEEALLAILPQHKASLTIAHNEHKSVYMTPIQEVGHDDFWVSEQEAYKAEELDELWTIQWYPETPIGSHKIAASSLAALLRHINSEKQ